MQGSTKTEVSLKKTFQQNPLPFFKNNPDLLHIHVIDFFVQKVLGFNGHLCLLNFKVPVIIELSTDKTQIFK
jgi:hypothetical protein